MLTRAALVVCLFATGCIEESYENGRLGGKSLQKELCPTGCSDDVSRYLAGTDVEAEPLGDGRFVIGGAAEVCNALPSNGLCALACDAVELQKHVGAGTCINFRCALTDGRDLLVGQCAPDVDLTN